MILRKIGLGLCILGIVTCVYLIGKGLTTPPAKVEHTKYSSIVRLTQDGRTFCSGTVISSTRIITAAHCVLIETPFGSMLNPMSINIRPIHNQNLNVEAQTLTANPQMDTAILYGDFRAFENRPYIDDPETLTEIRKKETKFVSCGYPLNGNLYCSHQVFKRPYGFTWETDGVLLPGMSGGPAMLPDGTLIGVNVAVEGDKSLIAPLYNVLESTKGLAIRPLKGSK